MARAKAVAKKPARGVRITAGSTWKLIDKGGTHREFAATVIDTFYVGGRRIALLSVPARVKEQRKRRKKRAA